LKKPILFRFSPGQFAFLRINGIDNHWHPFSIASGPESSELEFYIEVHGKHSWTTQLWDLLDVVTDEEISSLRMFVEVMGPYGTCLAKTEEYSHVISLGAGTGEFRLLNADIAW
jgi:predicted ferric reductase